MTSSKHPGVCLLGLLALMGSIASGAAAWATEEATPSTAPPARAEKDWEVEFTPFLWVAGMNGHVGVRDSDVPVSVGFINILENLKGTAMADMVVRYRRIGLFGDGVWLRVDSGKGLSGPAFTNAEVVMNSAFGTGAAFFRFEPKPGLTIDPYIGARWWRINTEIDLDGGVASPFSGESTITWADPVFGFMLRYAITDRWFVRASGDVGGGVSKYEWQALGATGYNFTDWFALDVGYRINGVKYDRDGFLFDVNVSGLVTGLRFRM